MRMKEMKNIIETQKNTLKNRKKELQNLKYALEIVSPDYLIQELQDIINKM